MRCICSTAPAKARALQCRNGPTPAPVWSVAPLDAGHRLRDMVHLRWRDVLEHFVRVFAQVRRLERSAQSAVHMHFSAFGRRSGDIMRTLAALTAIVMPLNIVAGSCGMNLEAQRLIQGAAPACRSPTA
jgi:magnesium transporter